MESSKSLWLAAEMSLMLAEKIVVDPTSPLEQALAVALVLYSSQIWQRKLQSRLVGVAVTMLMLC